MSATSEPAIWVCGLSDMPDLVERLQPGRLISLLPGGEQPPTPPQVRGSDHLRVLVGDIVQPRTDPLAPAEAHIEQLISFLRSSPPHASILIHCLAGVSRSPAAALVALALEMPGRELEAAAALRRAAPFVEPNRLIVELADTALERRGALVAALEFMGERDVSVGLAAFMLPRVI
jgi:predicted protein tyrosine phosphatase